MRHKKKIAALILGVAAILISWKLFAVWAVLMFVYIINRLALSRNNRQLKVFGAYSEIRNVDVLIVGDMIKPDIVVDVNQSCVQIKAPFRNLESCYELIRHTHSILNDESGKSCIIAAVKKKYMNHKGFSVFDVPFLHSTTIKKHGLEDYAGWRDFPFLYHRLLR